MNALIWARMIPIWAYVALAALLVIGVQQWRVHHYRAQAITLQSAVDTFQSTQDTNMATIAALRGTVADWAQKCTAEVHEARQQAQLSVSGDAKRQTTAHKTIQALQATYEHDPDVKAWADTHVPDVVANRLRGNGSTD